MARASRQQTRKAARAAAASVVEDVRTAVPGGVPDRLQAIRPRLAPTARRIADYVLTHAADVVHMSVTEVAEQTGASEGSVVSLCQQIGARGFQQLKIALARDLVQPVQFIHEDLARNDDVGTAAAKIFHSGMQAMQDTLKVLDTKALGAAVKAIVSARRVEIYGIGSAAPIAEDANYRLLRIGIEFEIGDRFPRAGDLGLADRPRCRRAYRVALRQHARDRHRHAACEAGRRNDDLHHQLRQIAPARAYRHRAAHDGAGDQVSYRGDDEPHRPAGDRRRADRLPCACHL